MKPQSLTPYGSTLGVLGNGQLGRMFCQAAKRHGYKTLSWGPPGNSPCHDVSDDVIEADWADTEALKKFCSRCRSVTVELEQLPFQLLESVQKQLPLHPSAEVIGISQDRIMEKTWLFKHGFPVAPFAPIRDADDIEPAARITGLPAVLKTSSGGYDGRGQVRVNSFSEIIAAWDFLGKSHCILEAWIPHEREVSVVTARNSEGQTRCFPVCENIHANHILAMTIFPARIEDSLAEKTRAYASQIAQSLRTVGLLTVEFFLNKNGELLVNEIAPRPHNSGHVTIEACSLSQFDMQVLTMTGASLPPIEVKYPGVMVNLLGQLWEDGQPDFARLAQNKHHHLQLYGKDSAKKGRKMGHLTITGEICSKKFIELQKLAETQNPALLSSLA